MLYGVLDERIASVMVLSPMGKKKLTRLLESTEVLGFVHSMYLVHRKRENGIKVNEKI